MVVETLRCAKCEEAKLPEEFNLNRSNVSGRSYWCRSCAAAQYATTPAHIRRRRSLKSRYGLEDGEFEGMLDAQLGVCAICEQPETVLTNNNSGEVRSLAVDHDHATGEVRGLLCTTCNAMLGYAKDSPFTLAAGAAYLLREPWVVPI